MPFRPIASLTVGPQAPRGIAVDSTNARGASRWTTSVYGANSDAAASSSAAPSSPISLAARAMAPGPPIGNPLTLTTLSSKRDLAMAALDPDSQVSDVDVRTQAADLKDKLKVLLGARPDAPVDASVKHAADVATSPGAIEQAASTFLGAALQLLGEMAGGQDPEQRRAFTDSLRTGLDAKIATDDRGRPRLSIAMPSRETRWPR